MIRIIPCARTPPFQSAPPIPPCPSFLQEGSLRLDLRAKECEAAALKAQVERLELQLERLAGELEVGQEDLARAKVGRGGERRGRECGPWGGEW
jgi:hypothetical protein